MKNLVKKLFKLNGNPASHTGDLNVPITKDINQTTNAIFEQYKKSFKDLARYDREGKVTAN